MKFLNQHRYSWVSLITNICMCGCFFSCDYICARVPVSGQLRMLEAAISEESRVTEKHSNSYNASKTKTDIAPSNHLIEMPVDPLSSKQKNTIPAELSSLEATLEEQASSAGESVHNMTLQSNNNEPVSVEAPAVAAFDEIVKSTSATNNQQKMIEEASKESIPTTNQLVVEQPMTEITVESPPAVSSLLVNSPIITQSIDTSKQVETEKSNDAESAVEKIVRINEPVNTTDVSINDKKDTITDAVPESVIAKSDKVAEATKPDSGQPVDAEQKISLSTVGDEPSAKLQSDDDQTKKIESKKEEEKPGLFEHLVELAGNLGLLDQAKKAASEAVTESAKEVVKETIKGGVNAVVHPNDQSINLQYNPQNVPPNTPYAQQGYAVPYDQQSAPYAQQGYATPYAPQNYAPPYAPQNYAPPYNRYQQQNNRYNDYQQDYDEYRQ